MPTPTMPLAISRESTLSQHKTKQPRTPQKLKTTAQTPMTDNEPQISSATYPNTDTLGGAGPTSYLATDGQYFTTFNDGHNQQLLWLTDRPLK